MSQKIYAVFTGELADSSRYSQEILGKIPETIRESVQAVNKTLKREDKLDYEVIRMDQFMGIIETPATALHSIIMLAAQFRYHSYKELEIRMDLKLSLAIGSIELFQKNLRESDGTAVREAMNRLGAMKRNQRLSIVTPDKNTNGEFAVACSFMDIIMHDWSDEQAEALFLRLSGMNQTNISKELKISQPAVNRRLKAAHHEAIQKFVKRYNSILSA